MTFEGRTSPHSSPLPALSFSFFFCGRWVQILTTEGSGDLLWENSYGANLRERMLGLTGIKRHGFCSYTGCESGHVC